MKLSRNITVDLKWDSGVSVPEEQGREFWLRKNLPKQNMEEEFDFEKFCPIEWKGERELDWEWIVQIKGGKSEE